jgi:ADP-heptose:LPS heptosyltransferase
MVQRRILVVKLRRIGDLVLATPTLRILKQLYPHARVTLVTTWPAAQLFQRSEMVDRVVPFRGRSWSELVGIARGLRSERPDLAVNLHASWKSALLTKLSGAPRRVVHNHSGVDYFGTIPLRAHKVRKSHIERDLDCVRSLGWNGATPVPYIDLRPDEVGQGEEILEGAGVRGDRPRVLVAPGASAPSKRWPGERFLLVAERLAERGYEPVILVDPQDQSTPGNGRWPRIELANLRLLGAAISRCTLCIGNDSGVAHIAVAVGTATLTLFGPEHTREWHPYSGRDHVAIMKPVECRGWGCGKRDCADHRCMELISVDEVVDKAVKILEAVGSDGII